MCVRSALTQTIAIVFRSVNVPPIAIVTVIGTATVTVGRTVLIPDALRKRCWLLWRHHNNILY